MSEATINLTDEQKLHFEALSENEQSEFLANFSKAETPEAQKEAISSMIEIYNKNQKENKTREQLGLEPKIIKNTSNSQEEIKEDNDTEIGGIFLLPIIYASGLLMALLLGIGGKDSIVIIAIWLSALLIATTPFFYYKKENALLTKAIIWFEYLSITPLIISFILDGFKYTDNISEKVVSYYSIVYHLFF